MKHVAIVVVVWPWSQDGQWTAKATQNGIERNITVQPNGTTNAR